MGDVKHISQSSAAIISWIVINVINFFQLLFQKYTVPGKFDWSDLIYYPISSITIGILLIYLFLLPVFKTLSKQSLPLQISLFFVHGLLYSFVFIGLTFLQIAFWSENLSLQAFSDTVLQFAVTDFHNVAKNYFFLLAVYFAVEYLNKREETMHHQRKLEKQLHDVRMQTLESKLHPHFLFNSLNGIMALVSEDPKNAEKAIVELSDLLRFALDANLSESISIKEELDLLRKYIAIEKMRYEDQLEVNLVITNDVDHERKILPPLILQPIVENAIKHGFKGIKYPLMIFVEVNNNMISIKNNGAQLDKKIVFGAGLKIVIQRLAYYFQTDASLNLFQDNGYVVCEIKGLNL